MQAPTNHSQELPSPPKAGRMEFMFVVFVLIAIGIAVIWWVDRKASVISRRLADSVSTARVGHP